MYYYWQNENNDLDEGRMNNCYEDLIIIIHQILLYLM